MICEKCKKNNATVFYRENVNGKEKKYALCTECAEKLSNSGEISLNNDLSFGSFFADDPMIDLFGSLFAPTFALEAKNDRKKCSLCGSTFESLIASGKVGCPKCYETFSAELEPTVRRIHGTTKHNGKAPGKFRAKLDKIKQIGALEIEMKKAIGEQNFERAAEIRDQLKDLRANEN